MYSYWLTTKYLFQTKIFKPYQVKQFLLGKTCFGLLWCFKMSVTFLSAGDSSQLPRNHHQFLHYFIIQPNKPFSEPSLRFTKFEGLNYLKLCCRSFNGARGLLCANNPHSRSYRLIKSVIFQFKMIFSKCLFSKPNHKSQKSYLPDLNSVASKVSFVCTRAK